MPLNITIYLTFLSPELSSDLPVKFGTTLWTVKELVTWGLWVASCYVTHSGGETDFSPCRQQHKQRYRGCCRRFFTVACLSVDSLNLGSARRILKCLRLPFEKLGLTFLDISLQEFVVSLRVKHIRFVVLEEVTCCDNVLVTVRLLVLLPLCLFKGPYWKQVTTCKSRADGSSGACKSCLKSKCSFC